jgi:hypothetical protein
VKIHFVENAFETELCHLEALQKREKNMFLKREGEFVQFEPSNLGDIHN